MVSAPSLLLPSSVRGLASCASDGAVRVACATPSSTFTSSEATSTSPSVLSVAVAYRATPRAPATAPLLLRLTWSRSPLGPPTLSFAPSASSPAVQLRRRRGTRFFPASDDGGGGSGGEQQKRPQMALFWDLTAARYDATSPEPVGGFYVVAVAGSEVVLAVGELAAEFVKAKFEGQIPTARVLPAARRDRVVVAAAEPGHPHRHRRRHPDAPVHTARVRFAEGAPEHEVAVGCRAASGVGAGDEELWVSVDGKRAVHARRLRWNFRGNQTVFVDGAPVDVMWDLHGWWFRDPPGCAVVMLRARSALESRLWLEEEAAAPGFSLVVQAFRTPP
ncbi:hypothetical protein ACP70R_047845 [Stipagrostis hirtigluma subsp. patula]